MLRSTLLLTAGFIFLPASALAADGDCPLHKRLEAQKTAQTAELSPITVPTAVVEAPLISTPRQTVIASPAPSRVIAAERGVDIVAQQPVQVAENQAQTTYGSGTPEMKKESKKEMAMIASPHAAWTSILQGYVSAPDAQGLTHFGYGKLKTNSADKAKLASYIKSLEATNTDALSRNEAIAHFSNLYNALTIDLIIQNYPLGSIRKAKTYNGEKVGGLVGPWKKVKTSVNGQTLSLNDVEHEILRKKFPSPYVHYMVNCASVGCPNLLNTAWEASTLDSVRKQAASDYINSPRGVKITSKGLVVSSIFKWFKEDFGGSKANILKHIRQHANPELAAAIDGGATITGYDYDWSLNE